MQGLVQQLDSFTATAFGIAVLHTHLLPHLQLIPCVGPGPQESWEGTVAVLPSLRGDIPSPRLERERSVRRHSHYAGRGPESRHKHTAYRLPHGFPGFFVQRTCRVTYSPCLASTLVHLFDCKYREHCIRVPLVNIPTFGQCEGFCET